jgi:glycosyltransferase involved in cell wall biosynthesis
MPKKIVAIIAVRNEQYYIRQCIEDLLANELEVAVLDNESTDDTSRIISDISHKLIFQGKIPFDGYCRWTELLTAKAALAKQLKADWIVHVDADEILRSCINGETIRAGIERAAGTGANVINFDEFVFVPRSEDEDYRNSNYVKEMKWYYFFDLSHPRRMLAYSSNLSNIEGAGHQVKGRKALHGENFILCHYIALSLQMLRDKYKNRTFPENELAKGWHLNRIGIEYRIGQPVADDFLKYWPDNRVESFDRSSPTGKHFWDWQ